MVVILDGHNNLVTPVPIPNTEVKLVMFVSVLSLDGKARSCLLIFLIYYYILEYNNHFKANHFRPVMGSKLHGEGSVELAREFKKDSVRFSVTPDERGYFDDYAKKGDLQVRWSVLTPMDGEGEDVTQYMGAALVRKGKVHFYDRYPMGGGPYRLKDFTNPEFRKRCEIIAKNIEELVAGAAQN